MRIKGTLPQRQLGKALRRLREEAGLTLEEAAPKLEWSTSKLGRIETAHQVVDVHGVRSMLDLYDIGGAQWTEIIELTREARKKDEWHTYGITVFRGFRPQRTEAELDHHVRVRLVRQRRLTKDPQLELVAIVDETVLRRPIGGVEVMRDQLRHLISQAALPSVCFQVLPVSIGAHQGLNGSFVVLGFAEYDEPAIAYTENVVSATHVDKEAEVLEHELVFDKLRSEALSPRDSVDLVARLTNDL